VSIRKTIRVLVVDDSATYLYALCAFLKGQTGIEVVGTASHGLELMQLAEEVRPDLVITDLHIPHLNGLECALRLRPLMPETRFIVFTDMSLPFTEAECRVPGADFYVYKEQMPEKIITAIRKLFPDVAQPDARQTRAWKEDVFC
jgi:DNA-binding NarL/FixJ family response regulator